MYFGAAKKKKTVDFFIFIVPCVFSFWAFFASVKKMGKGSRRKRTLTDGVGEVREARETKEQARIFSRFTFEKKGRKNDLDLGLDNFFLCFFFSALFLSLSVALRQRTNYYTRKKERKREREREREKEREQGEGKRRSAFRTATSFSLPPPLLLSFPLSFFSSSPSLSLFPASGFISAQNCIPDARGKPRAFDKELYIQRRLAWPLRKGKRKKRMG